MKKTARKRPQHERNDGGDVRELFLDVRRGKRTWREGAEEKTKNNYRRQVDRERTNENIKQIMPRRRDFRG